MPEDLTLVWPDDNYGYIQRLNTEEERNRSGGSGVYYHASYWGRPHDYLWLPSTNPALMREEMVKAYENGANRLWVLNVGDIKSIEYSTNFFLDMAYNINAFKGSGYEKKYLREWINKLFGKEKVARISTVVDSYYQLAFERRPEFMGWSQTEPETKTKYTAYNHFNYGDEAQRRIDQYEAIEKEVKALRKECNANDEAAFYQLVYYPVVSASWMNKKFLYRDKAYVYGMQNRIAAYEYAAQSKAAYDCIVKETAYYNGQLSGGKWKGIISMEPRNLPVYLAPVLPKISIDKVIGWDAVPEGYDTIAYQNKLVKRLPDFVAGLQQSYFIDVFLTDSIAVAWQAKPSANWIQLSTVKGKLLAEKQQTSIRLLVTVDWTKVPAASKFEGSIEFSANGKKINVVVNALRPAANDFTGYKGFAEQNGLISIYAAHYNNKIDRVKSKWQLVQGLGHSHDAVESFVTEKLDTTAVQQQSAQLTYTFYSFSSAAPKLTLFTLPTYPLNKNFGMRYAVSIDDGPVKIVDFKTVGRSEEWKQNVLRNEAIKEIELPQLQPGKHTLKIYAIDPGVVLDRILIRFGKIPGSYSVVPETKKG